MISVFEYSDYRAYVTDRFNEMPKRGHGQLRKWAEFMEVHTTLVSQILHGSKCLTTDQSVLTAVFLNLNELETEYFAALVQYERAGHPAARRFALKQLTNVKNQAQDLKMRLTAEATMSEEKRAVFYSDWACAGVRQITAIKGFQEPDTIAKELGLPVRKVRRILEFLVAAGLCKESTKGYTIGPASTHLEASSPWVRVHHFNWRERAVASLDSDNEKNLYYSSPLTIAENDAERVRERIIKAIEEINAIVDPSPSEVLYCLNLDWFRLSK